MKKKGQLHLVFILILMVIMLSLIVFFFFRANIGLMVITSNTVLEFSNSNSSILSNLNKTYLSNEQIIANATFKDKTNLSEINISIDGTEIIFEEINNNTIGFFLDTLIRNRNSKETKLLTIHGRTIDGKLFIDEENYEVLVSTEEFLIERAKSAEQLAKSSNKIASGALFIAIVSIIINIIQLIKIRGFKKK